MRSAYEAAWAGAETLKRHCHHVIQTLGPGTPPEVFLYRGNAYYALGFPYFALADYENASRFLSFSSSCHQGKCWKALKHFPAQQEVLYLGTSSHVHLCVTPFLDAKAAVQTFFPPYHAERSKIPLAALDRPRNTMGGSGAACGVPSKDTSSAVRTTAPSKEDFYALECPSLMCRKVMAVELFGMAGLPVMKVIPSSVVGTPHAASSDMGGPWLQYPLYDKHCSRCGVPLYNEKEEEEAYSSCGGGCRIHGEDDSVSPRTCSVDQSPSTTRHPSTPPITHSTTVSSRANARGRERRTFPCTNPKCFEEYCSRDCRQLALQEYHSHVCTNEAAQGIEMDLFTRMQQTNEVVEHRELATLLLTLRILYASLSAQSSPTALPQIRILSGRATFTPSFLSGSMRESFHRIADALRVLTTISYEEFIGIYSRAWCNAHWVEEEEHGKTPPQASSQSPSSPLSTLVSSGPSTALAEKHDPLSYGSASYRSIQLHLPYAMFNHSCDPNVTEGAVASALPRSDRSGGASKSSPPMRTLVTTRPIEKGEELTRSYFPSSWLSLPYAERSAVMKAMDFVCQCPRCLKKE